MKARRLTPGEVRVEGESQKIRGVASVFYNGEPGTEYRLWKNTVERIMPTAFDRVIDEGDDVRALFNHSADQVLGRTKSGTLSLEIRDDGLHYSVEPAETTVYRDVAEMIKRGDVDGSSFGFEILDEKWKREGELEVREIYSVKLYDVSPVTFPAYEGTAVGLRMIGSDEEAQETYAKVVAERKRRADRDRRQVLISLVEAVPWS